MVSITCDIFKLLTCDNPTNICQTVVAKKARDRKLMHARESLESM
jgi:hypothetical protein